MAELLLCVTDEVRPDPLPQDGDIVEAFNDRRIGWANAEMICHHARAQRNASGLLVLGSLAHRWHERVYTYRAERVSATEYLRTNLITGQADLIGPVPNARGERTNLRATLRRRKATPGARIFGEDGAEVWYGGPMRMDAATVEAIWARIEEHSALRRHSHRLYPLGRMDKRSYLPLSLDADVDDATADLLGSPEVDDSSPGRKVRNRAHSVPWRDVLPAAHFAAALDKAREFDARELMDRGQPVRAARSANWRKPLRGRI